MQSWMYLLPFYNLQLFLHDKFALMLQNTLIFITYILFVYYTEYLDKSGLILLAL